MLVPPKYKKRLSDPGRRSTIPDRYLKQLSPHHYAVRLHNRKVKQENATIYNPTAVLSGKALHDLVSKLAGLEIDPQISATNKELGLAKSNDAALLSRIEGYNRNTNNYMAGVVSQNAAAQGKLTSDLAANTASTLGALKSDNAGDQQLERADADLRGSGLGGGMDTRLAGDYARQVSGTQAQLGAQTNQSLVQAGGWTGLATIMAGASAMRGNDALAQAANYGTNREAGLANKISTLESSRGATEAKYLMQARTSEFEKAAAVQTLGIKSAEAQADLINANKKPESTYHKELAKTAVKVGLTPAAFARLSPERKRALIKAAKAGQGKAGKSLDRINNENMAREAASHGYTLREWNNLTPQQRQKIADPGKAGPKPKSPWLTQTKQNSSISDARKWYSTFSSSEYAKGKHGYKETRDHLSSIIGSNVAPGVINAITDKHVLGYMTLGTKKMLTLEGIIPGRIANALGIAIHA